MSRFLCSQAVRSGALSILLLASTSVQSQAPSTESALEEVFVVSQQGLAQSQVASSVSVLTQDDIDALGYFSLTDVLRTQVGVATDNSGGVGRVSALRIRGEEAFRTLILLDGIDISDPTGPQIAPRVEHLAASSEIERVEVLRGPHGLQQGADSGGVVNILTRRVRDGIAAGGSAEGGRYDTAQGNAFFGVGGERGDAFVSASHFDTEGFNSRTDFNPEERDGYENTTVHGKFGLNFGPLRAQIVARDVSSEGMFDNCFGASGLVDDCESHFDQQVGRFTLAFREDARFHRIGVSRTEVESASLTQGEFSFGSEGTIDVVDYFASLPVSENVTINFGGDAERVEIEAGPKQDVYGVFLESQLKFGRWFTSAGLRYDDSDDFGEHISLRIAPALSHEIDDQRSFKLRASAGTGFRAPSPFELDFNERFATGAAAETVLEEEKSRGLDFGFDYHVENDWSASLTLYTQEVENEIEFDLQFFSGYLQGGERESRGIELEVQKLLGESWVIDFNLTRNKTHRDDESVVIRRPKWLANLGLGYSWSDTFDAHLHYRYSRDAEDFGSMGQEALDDYGVLGGVLQWHLNRHVTLKARVTNATDRNYEEVLGFNTAGQAFYFGAKVNF